jgi:3-deoxy-D-manno-octulosonic-acid transferase
MRKWEEIQSVLYEKTGHLTDGMAQRCFGWAVKIATNLERSPVKSLLLNAIYVAVLVLAIPWLIWRAVRYGKNKRGWGQKLFGSIPRREDCEHNQNCVWFHAVSVGEVNLLATLIDRLKVELPGWQFAISTTTESGYDLACRKYAEHQVVFCPFDFSWAVNRMLDRLNPSLVVLAELEVWPNLVRMVKRRGLPIAIVNGRLSEKSFGGYQRIGWLMRKLLSKFDLIAAQSEVYSERFLALGASPERVSVVGNVKFDGARLNSNNPLTQRLVEVAGFAENDFVFVAGSTQPEEDRMAIDVWARLSQRMESLRLVLVPRHMQNVAHAEDYLGELGIEYSLRSDLPGGGSPSVLVVNTVGELGGWWGRADVAFVGGSMGRRGGQNMIEPAAYGVPVCFGPNTWNFKDVSDLLTSRAAAEVVSDAKQMGDFVSRMAGSDSVAMSIGAKAQALVLSQQGAADRTIKKLVCLLQPTLADTVPTKAA